MLNAMNKDKENLPMTLYIPAAFQSDAASHIARQAPFATLLTCPEGQLPMISHLPLIFDPAQPDTLIGHLARSNPHAEVLFSAPSIAIFQAEHGYISPAWYQSSNLVPTWNYRVSHAECQAEAVSNEQLLAHLEALVFSMEGPDGWSGQQLADGVLEKMSRGIVGFRLRVSRWQAKEKLSQNRNAADQTAVIAALSKGSGEQQALAAAMRQSAQA